MTVTCKNCGVNFKGSYCYNCSQKAGTGRLKVSNVLHELWHNFTHTDRSALGLVSALFQKPGVVIQEYIDGKRKKYFNPYTFFLVTGAIVIFLTGKVFHYEDALYDYRNEFSQAVSKNYTLILLCSMPVLALILKGIFANKKYNYAEWISFLVFYFCMLNVVQIGIQLLYFPFIKYHRFILGYPELSTYILFLIVLIIFIKPTTVWSWLQCFIAMILVFICVEMLAKSIYLWWAGVPVEALIKSYKII